MTVSLHLLKLYSGVKTPAQSNIDVYTPAHTLCKPLGPHILGQLCWLIVEFRWCPRC